MNLLVTGGLGFIGSNLCHYLIKNYPEFDIINLDKVGLGSNPANHADLLGKERYHFVQGDICQKEILRGILPKVDAIINIAAETHVDRSIKDPNLFVKNNTEGVLALLDTIREINEDLLLLQVSTDEVYGDAKNISFTEKDRLKPSNPYSASKAAAEMFLMAYQRTYDLHIKTTRCTNNYGPFQYPEKLIPKTIIRALKNLSIPVYGNGENIRDWLFVDDHCEAILQVLLHGDSGKVYNVSADNEISNVALVSQILSMLNKPESLIKFVQDRPGHDFRYSLDSTLLREDLGWKPKYDFQDAILSTIEWYQQNTEWWTKIATPQVLHPEPWKT